MYANTSLAANTQENPTIVDSLLHPLALPIRRLLVRSDRRELNQILIDDEENILQALEAGISIQSVYYSGEGNISNVLRQKLPRRVTIHEVAKRTCKKLFENEKISRVFAIAITPKQVGLETLLGGSRDVIVLEDVRISGNIGAIIRTSLALNAGGIVLLNADPVDIYDRRLIRASRGYVFSLPVVAVSTEEFLKACKRQDASLMVATTHADMVVHHIANLPQRLFVVFGSEKNGCSHLIMRAASHHVRIPINPKVESLNVSAAASVLLYNRIQFNSARL
jgi:TrmH family RNA methyltransferase